MNRAEMLADLFAFNAGWTRNAVKDMPAELRAWKPDAEANSIDVTLWHVARMTDIFLTRFLQGREQDEEIWFAEGWAERSGYDPRGLGIQGMGGVIGYTPREVAEIPDFGLETLLAYFDASTEAFCDYLRGLPDEEVDAMRRSFTSEQSLYAYVRHLLMDCARHCGEILTLQMQWAREHDREMVDAAP